MITINYPDKSTWKELLKRPALDSASLEEAVKSILADIKTNGDSAVKKYALQFDKAKLNSFEVNQEEINSAETKLSVELKNAIKEAKTNIETFHSVQKEQTQAIETTTGVVCWRKSVGIEKVGLYIPGGSAPLFSTVLMLGVPAKLAGCKEIILCTPSDSNGNINPAVLLISPTEHDRFDFYPSEERREN